jgi:hypothetical protein
VAFLSLFSCHQHQEKKRGERERTKEENVAKPTLSPFDIPFPSSKLLSRISSFKSYPALWNAHYSFFLV